MTCFQADQLGYFEVSDERLAGMADPRHVVEPQALGGWLIAKGACALVSLTEQPLPPRFCERLGLATMHVPVRDFDAPTEPDVNRITSLAARSSGTLVVHCRSGIGRTGTILACLLVMRGRGAGEAISRIREAKPSAINAKVQERFVHALAEARLG